MCRRIFVTLMLLFAANPAHAELLYRYVYVLKENHNAAVCSHMLGVFNRRFSHLWDYAPTPWTRSAAEYEFPVLPGMHPNADSNYKVWFSAFPTSLEFSAIHWQRGMAVPGGCPAGGICAGQTPEPVLVAHFDFDNDGAADTVIKNGFFSGYDAMFMGSEYLEVWRGQMLTLNDTPSLWDLAHPKDKRLAPIIMWGMYLRPFVYRHVTYVASYVPHFGKNFEQNQEPGPPPYPIQEDMLIEQFHFADRMDEVGRPQWSSDTVCDMRMERLNDR